MTSNQIAYANYIENKRHNKRSEQLTSRNIDVAESQVGLGYANLGEMYRHNYSTEQLTGAQIGETYRHNEAMEQLTGQQTDVRKQEADIKEYEAETKRMHLYSQWLPDWLVAAGYGINELMESATGAAINNYSEQVANNVHSNSNRKHRKR